MKFYLRQYKNDFVQANVSVKVNGDSFELSWFKGQQVVNLESNQPEVVYPTEPNATDTLTADKILTEKKTGLTLSNPHQIIACGVSEDSGKFVFVDVLKYTFINKGSTGLFKTYSNIQPIMYVLVPFADSSIQDWKFIALADSLTVDDQAVTETFDIDINKTLADVSSENLPNIALSKQGTIVSAQLKNADGSTALKSNIDIYFETTAGYLTKARSKTNDQGIATTELIGATEGKVKAGFKYFSGKTELAV
jgi:hypothetical protein